MDGIHDMGGMHGFGPVLVPGSEEPYHERWERRVFALSLLIGVEKLGLGSRRAIREEMPPEEYLRASYYERWLWSAEEALMRKGTIAAGEVDRWLERLHDGESTPVVEDPEQARGAVASLAGTRTLGDVGDHAFAAGDPVRVRRMRPQGHTRCPRYVRGATGMVESIRGVDVLPDIGPYQGPREPVYAVAFRSDDLFGTSDEGSWTVMLDLYESYLEPV
jgi:nitrile hydratase beta subunit